MPKVKVSYLGALSPMLARREEYVSVGESATLGDLLQKLGLRYGEKFRCSLQNADGTLVCSEVAIVIDGLPVRDVSFLLKGDQEIQIALLPQMLGG
ncbi:MAG: MoaD/ThiS family protein [Deltaproteobacteria bacterium]|nr:MoaD/ThiS family protein [Deltaproteobacteria bacterium]